MPRVKVGHHHLPRLPLQTAHVEIEQSSLRGANREWAGVRPKEGEHPGNRLFVGTRVDIDQLCAGHRWRHPPPRRLPHPQEDTYAPYAPPRTQPSPTLAPTP